MQMLMVCKSWRNQFDENDVDLWYTISVEYDISMSKPNLKRSLRSTTDHRKVFFRTYFEKQREMNERHELLIVQAKTILEGVRDQPAKLAKLIEKCFPNPRYFNPDTHGKTMEDNTLLTLCCRYFQNKCIKMMVNRFSANANIPDVGGFTPLILCAYHGNFAGVLFLLRQKVDLLAVGRLRSGPRLIAEQWAAIQGHMVIFRYLHALRRRTFLSARKQERDRVTSVVSTSALVSAAASETASQQPTCGDSVGGYEDIPISSETCDNQFNVEDANTTSADELILPPLFGTTLGLLFTNDELGPEDSNWSALTAATVSASEAPPNLFAVPLTNMSMFIEGGRSGVLALATSSSSSSSRGSVVSLCHPADHFCLCQRGYEGQMIACDAASCPVEWYHFECVGLLARVRDFHFHFICSSFIMCFHLLCFTASGSVAVRPVLHRCYHLPLQLLHRRDEPCWCNRPVLHLRARRSRANGGMRERPLLGGVVSLRLRGTDSRGSLRLLLNLPSSLSLNFCSLISQRDTGSALRAVEVGSPSPRRP